MNIRTEIIDYASMGTFRIINVANLLTEENMVNDENLELVEDQYSRDVFENEVEDDNEYRVKIYF